MRRVGDAAEKELGKTDDRLNKMGGSMQRVGAGMVAAAGVAVTGLVKLAQASEEAAAESRKLDQAMDTNASFAREGRESFDDLAASLQDLTGADGDAITGMLGFLGTLGRTADEAQKAAPLIVDLAKRFGLELEPAARLVNNAIEGNTSRLQRLIGPIDDTEGAIGALQRTVGGFAEREAQTFSGQLEILKQNLGDVAEGVGGGVISAFNDLLGPVKSLAERFTELNPATQEAAGKLLAFGTAGVGLIGTASFVAGSVLKMSDTFGRAATAMKLSADATSNLKTGLGAVGIAAAGLGAVVIGIQAINEEARQMGEELGNSARQAALGAPSFAEFAGTIDRITAGIEDLDATRRSSTAIWDADYRRQILEGQLALEDERGALLAVQHQIEDLAASENISLDAATRQVLATQQQAAAHDELVDAVGETEAAEIELADSSEGLAEVTAAIADAANSAADAFARLYGETTSSVEAVAAHNAALDELSASLVENGATLDLNTEQGRANLDAALDVGSTLADLIGIRLEETGSLDAARAAGELYVENLRNQLREAGLTEEEVAAYIDTLNLTPADINTLISQTGTETAAGFLNTYQAQLDAIDPEKRTEILALINRGLYNDAEYLLSELVRSRTVWINPAYGGGTTPMQNNYKPRAKGGPVSAGQGYIVGDKFGVNSASAELFVPDQDGTVFPIDRSGGGSGGGSGGNEIIEVHLHQYLDGRQIDDSLVRLKRINGTLGFEQ